MDGTLLIVAKSSMLTELISGVLSKTFEIGVNTYGLEDTHENCSDLSKEQDVRAVVILTEGHPIEDDKIEMIHSSWTNNFPNVPIVWYDGSDNVRRRFEKEWSDVIWCNENNLNRENPNDALIKSLFTGRDPIDVLQLAIKVALSH